MKAKPNAKLLIITAYPTDPLAKRAMDAGAIALVKKPFEIGKILDFREWAAESNYVLHEVPLPNLHKEYEWLNFFSEHHQKIYNDSRKFYNEGAFLCEASECYSAEVVFNSPSRSTSLDEFFAIFSDKLNYLLRNCHKPYMRMLEGIAYIRNVSNDLNHALFDFSCFIIVI